MEGLQGKEKIIVQTVDFFPGEMLSPAAEKHCNASLTIIKSTRYAQSKDNRQKSKYQTQR